MVGNVRKKDKTKICRTFWEQLGTPPNNKDKLPANKITEEKRIWLRTLKNLCRVLAFSVFTL